MLKTGLVFGCLLALAGCVSNGPNSPLAADVQTCRNAGYIPATDAMADCLSRVAAARG